MLKELQLKHRRSVQAKRIMLSRLAVSNTGKNQKRKTTAFHQLASEFPLPDFPLL
jgi:hypothetical protein